MKQLILTIALFVFMSAPTLAEEAHSGFGESFAQVGHAGFDDPQDVVATNEDLASELAGIEPAAGEEDNTEEDAAEAQETTNDSDAE